MKIVDRATFLELPEDTVFADYANDLFGELGPVSIKGYTYRDANGVAFDFDRQELTQLEWRDGAEFERVVRAAEGGASIALDLDCTVRDDCAEQRRYAVWEPEDVAQLIDRLQRCASRQTGATLPTQAGFYWARCTAAFREEHGADAFEGEAVIEYTGGPDHEGCAEIPGADILFTVSDFEWIEGPIRRKT